MRTQQSILLAEDDEVDAEAVQRAFKELKITNPLVLTKNGEEALAHLRNPANSRPCVILMDLNMPRMGGLELLAEIKKDEAFRRIPVVVFTSSTYEEDKIRSFDLSVAGYMIKPTDPRKFSEMLHTIDLYWTASESLR